MEDRNLDNKKLSKETKSLVSKIQALATKAGHLLPQLYENLIKDGLDPFEARDYMKEIVDVSDRTIRRALPMEAKRSQMVREHHAQIEDKMSTNSIQTVNNKKEVKHEVKEVEPSKYDDRYYETLPEPSHNAKVKLNCKTFKQELRMGLLNNSIVELQVKDNEVVKIE